MTDMTAVEVSDKGFDAGWELARSDHAGQRLSTPEQVKAYGEQAAGQVPVDGYEGIFAASFSDGYDFYLIETGLHTRREESA